MKPIFIIGVHRSGTTLLRFMLSSHPRIYIPPESDFIPRFFRKYEHRPLTRKQAGRLLDLVFNHYRFVKEWDGPLLSIEDCFREGDPNLTYFLNLLYSTYAIQNDAIRWGDKTPIYSSYVPLLAELFPRSQFVHLIRDGRDVALSMLSKWGASDFHIDIYFAARNWVKRTLQACSDGSALGPQRYYQLCYEELVMNPKENLRSLCEFLDEPYSSEMTTPQYLGQQKIPPGGFHDQVRKPLNSTRVGRWRMEMAPKDLRLFQQVAGVLLTDLGYPLAETSTMSTSEIGRMRVLQTKYEILQWGRRTSTTLGLLPPI